LAESPSAAVGDKQNAVATRGGFGCVPRPVTLASFREKLRKARNVSSTPARQVAVIVLTTCILGERVREIISNVRNYLLGRLGDLRDHLDAFRYRAESRFHRADLRIGYALALGALLGAGVLAATMASSDPETIQVVQPDAGRESSSSGSEVVVETVMRQGRTVRLVRTTPLLRERPGTTVRDVVTPPARTIRETQPAHTIRETHTVTTQEVATVTEIQQTTVTVFETVTCKPKEC
jgi:hypothetical protein